MYIKPVISVLIFCLINFVVVGQNIYNHGAHIVMSSGATINAKDLQFETSGSNRGKLTFVSTGSNLILTGNIYNNSDQDVDMTSQSGTGTVTFAGSGIQNLSYNTNMIIFSGLTVNTGSSVQVPATKYLTVKGILTLDGGLTLKSSVSGTASLLDGNCYGSVNNTGNLSVERYLTTDQTNPFYHFVSSPVHNAPLSSIQEQSYGNYNVYWYDETNPSSNLDDGWTRIVSSNLTRARGYTATYLYNGALTRTFTGPLNTSSDISINCTYTTSSGTPDPQGWNLIGNPYPSPLNVDTFIRYNTISGNKRITGTLYYWSDVSGTAISRSDDYATVNLSGGVPAGIAASGNQSKVPGAYIGIGQAFFVQVSATYGTGNVIFKNSMRTHETGNQFFTPDIDTNMKFRLNLTDSDSNANNILIAFLLNATDGFDPMYDGHKLQGNKDIALYSLNGKEEMCIHALPPLTTERVIPLGFKAGLGGKYEFFLGELNNMQDVEVYLEDLKLKKTVLLNKQPSYSFETSKGIINDRFVLRFKPSVISTPDNSSISSSITITTQKDKILVNLLDFNENDVKGNIIVYDATGKLITNSSIDNSTMYLDIPLAKGCYFVRVITAVKEKTGKVVVF